MQQRWEMMLFCHMYMKCRSAISVERGAEGGNEGEKTKDEIVSPCSPISSTPSTASFDPPRQRADAIVGNIFICGNSAAPVQAAQSRRGPCHTHEINDSAPHCFKFGMYYY